MKKTFRFLKWTGKKAALLLTLSIVLAVAALDVTLAYLITKTEPVENVFTPADLRVSMEGTDDVTNVGEVDVYVRAIAVANWASTEDEHTILADTPKVGVDFDVEFITDNWFLATDGFYYYRNALKPGESVKFLTSATQKTERTGFELHLEILSSAIQAYPADAVAEAWPAVYVTEDKTLAKVNSVK